MFISDLAFSTDGKQLAFWVSPGVVTSGCYSQGDIVVMDWGGGELIHLTDAQGDDRNPDWSPDGRIAFASDRSGSLQIYLMNADGSDLHRLTDYPIHNTHPRWSPDGKWIAYHNLSDSRSRLYIISPDGLPAGEPVFGVSPSWSPAMQPGGMQLGFNCFNEHKLDICIMHPDGSQLANLTRSAFDESCPAWSPDGNWLAFRVHRGIEEYISKVCVTCPGGFKEIRVTDESTPGGCPKWSPDGWKIVYLNVDDQGLWVINADGSGVIRLFKGHLFDFIWRPKVRTS